MGRTDEVTFVTECAAAWRALGARVTFESGWQNRGNGYSGNYEGCLVHHTAFLSSEANPFPARNTLVNGRSDLKGPLCNVAGPWCPPDAPWLHVIAAYPANHAGASGGRSMGPLPVTGLFNPRVLGLEIDYSGMAPMAPGQRRAALIFARGTCDVLGRPLSYARAHAETSITGKWDPGEAPNRTIDMAAFRRDAAALKPQEEDDMPSVQEIVDGLLGADIEPDPNGLAGNVRTTLRDARIIARRAEEKVEALDKKLDELLALLKAQQPPSA